MVDKVTQKGFEKILREGVAKPHNLGDKVYLVINGNSRDFSFRYTKNKKTRKYSLKRYHPQTNTLADARKRAIELNAMLAQGLDPHEEKQLKIDLEDKDKKDREIEDKRLSHTFEQVAYDLIEDKADTWTNSKSRQSWTNTLQRYAFPVIGHLPVSEITKEHILKILKPIWVSKYPTAKKLRQRIEAVFSRAIYYDLRSAGNPASYQDNLEIPLPPVSRVPTPHPALSYKELPEFVSELRKREGIGARALEFLILNANRTTEVRKARWEEINFDKRIWTIPVEEGRLGKTKKSHIVPLSEQSMNILFRLDGEGRVSEYIFPNTRSTNHLSDAGMDSVVKRMRKTRDWVDDFGKKITVHGFRSTMRDYIAEQTDVDHATAEICLAHTVGSAVERSYRRGDLLNKRRVAMQIWANYACATPLAKVVQIKA